MNTYGFLDYWLQYANWKHNYQLIINCILTDQQKMKGKWTNESIEENWIDYCQMKYGKIP